MSDDLPEKADTDLVLSYMRQTSLVDCAPGGLSDSTPGGLAAYTPVAPNIWLGFNNDCTVSISHNQDENGVPLSYLVIEPRDSNWVSIEAGLDMDTLKQTGFVNAVFHAAASSNFRIDAVVRMPRPDVRAGFVDTDPKRFILNPTSRQAPVQVFLDAETRDKMQPTDAHPRPVLIFFMQLRPITLSVSGISVSPVPLETE